MAVNGDPAVIQMAENYVLMRVAGFGDEEFEALENRVQDDLQQIEHIQHIVAGPSGLQEVPL